MIQYKNTGLNKFAPMSIGSAAVQGAGSAPQRSFFGRLWRGLLETAVGGPIYSILQELDGSSGFFDRPTTPTLDIQKLTAHENSIIEYFLANEFAEKCKTLLAKLEKITTIRVSALQLALINGLNNDLASVRVYLMHEAGGLSFSAQSYRNEFCEEIIFQIEKKVFAAIESSIDTYLAYDYIFKASSDILLPLKTHKILTVTATNYKIGKPVVTDNSTVFNPIEYVDDIIPRPVATEIATEIKTTANVTKNKSGINWIFLAIAGFVGYKILK